MQSTLEKMKIETTLNELKKKINLIHASKTKLDDSAVNKILMIDNSEPAKNYMEQASSWKDLRKKFGREQFYYSGTHYELIRRVIRIIKPKANDVVYDLGCGYGRFVLYGALVKGAVQGH